MSGSARSPVTCVFWNLNRSDRRALVSALAGDKHADIVVLAEHSAESSAMLDELRREVDELFVEPASEIHRLQLFLRRPSLDLREVYGDASKRLTMRILRYQETEFLFAAAHLVSKVNWSRQDQSAEMQVLANQIRQIEEEHGHHRTILCGDLNMNPFEDGLVQATGLHAMMTKTTVMTGSRKVQGREYPFFYNPMWGFFGDRTEGPPGTLYYRDSGHLSYEWNMFDQVLVRPDVLPWFSGDIEIITRIGENKLMDLSGRPNKEIGSDHFPIVFRLAATE